MRSAGRVWDVHVYICTYSLAVCISNGMHTRDGIAWCRACVGHAHWEEHHSPAGACARHPDPGLLSKRLPCGQWQRGPQLQDLGPSQTGLRVCAACAQLPHIASKSSSNAANLLFQVLLDGCHQVGFCSSCFELKQRCVCVYTCTSHRTAASLAAWSNVYRTNAF